MKDWAKRVTSIEGLPEWLVPMLPGLLKGSVILVLALIAGVAASLVKRMVRAIGRKRYETEERFVGSSWDLAAPLVQLLVFIFLMTIALDQVGFGTADLVANYGPRALTSLGIVAVAVVLSSWLNRSIRSYGERAHARNKADDTLFNFLASIIRYIILGLAVLMVLTQFGFQSGSLIAIVGATGLAIALALQDTLKAVAAGVMIAVFRPFRIGDWVTLNGNDGEVFEITPFTTSLKQVDQKVVSMTNDKVWGEPITNHTKQSRRRLDLYFDVHYDTDLDYALEVILGVANDHGRVLSKSETWVGVHRLGDWSIVIRLRAWVLAPEFVQVRADITKDIKQTFDRVGIEIPYPHQVEIVRDGVEIKMNRNPGVEPASVRPISHESGDPDDG